MYSLAHNFYKMAIVFSKDIREDKLLMAYNNNVVLFNSDSELAPVTAEVTGLGIYALLYPHPDGSFRFNFHDDIVAEINTKNFADDLEYELDSSDASTFTYDVENGCYLNGDIVFKINFEDLSNETETRNISFIAGAEQIESFKKNEILFADNNICILSPVEQRSNNKCYVKYWEGYPFEFSFYNRNNPTDDFTIKNITTGISNEFTSKSKVNSMFISDGRTDVTIENFIPLVVGGNELRFLIDDVDQNVNLHLEKADAQCGVYVKFLNKYGRWNYWLLLSNHFRNRSSKQIGEIENDFYNLEDTTSPTIQIGKIGDESIKCAGRNLNENDKLILEEIIDSPKIYLFTGERFSKSELSDWMEVRLKTSSFPVKAPNKVLYSYYIELDFPARTTQTI